MVMAKLYIICGNCGCNDSFNWEHYEADEDRPEGVYLFCENCTTIHSIEDNANLRQPKATG